MAYDKDGSEKIKNLRQDNLLQPEQLKLIREIQSFLREIKAAKGILFGSRAKGEEVSTSDVDLVVLAD
ncbi:MAG: nucleotidyltransferase domain-containing protein [Syntrophothermus sp.]